MKHQKFLLTGILACYFQIQGAVTLSEIRTASNNVIVVFFHGTNTNVEEVNINSLSEWTVNGQPVQSIERYATQSDESDHHIYLQVPVLAEGEQYDIRTPHGDTTFTFTARGIFCESIKTNQAAYSALATNNYALFAIWLGTGGSRQISGSLPGYEVFNTFTGEVVATGTLQELGDDQSSGDYVYRIDLSNVPEGGPYKVAVAGYGSSHPFGVGGIFSRRLAYTLFRGQFYQRCGIAIQPPYGWDLREDPCHRTVYDVDGPIGEANIDVSGSERQLTVVGGYHDAGDADRRAYHIANPIINLLIYEAWPELFFDGQYNLPDIFDENYNILGSGNDVPDIIDEAEWGTLVWEHLQNTDGSLHFGTETRGYPSPFDAPMDEDDNLYGTVNVDDRPAAVAAGLFMHLARVLAPYNPSRSTELRAKAALTYNYIENEMNDPEMLYYHVQRYLLTGEQASHDVVIDLHNIVGSYQNATKQTPGYSLNNNSVDNPGYFYAYIVENDRPTDPGVVNVFRQAIQDAADADIEDLGEHAYPVGNNTGSGGWGHNVRQPQYACASLLHWGLTGEQSYLNAAAGLMNYTLGLNPIGISYVTGLGFHTVHNPHDRESAYTTNQGWGPKPGITVFGPAVNPTGEVVPAIGSLPDERQWADNMDAISLTEFTIFETMTHYALYTVLSQGGTWDGTLDPYNTPVQKPGNRLSEVKLSLNDGLLSLQFNLRAATTVSGGLYDLNGKKLFALNPGRVQKGAQEIFMPLNTHAMKALKQRVVLVQLSGGNLNFSGKLFVH